MVSRCIVKLMPGLDVIATRPSMAQVRCRLARKGNSVRHNKTKASIEAFPPAVQILLRELRGVDQDGVHKRVRQLLPDLRQQAEYSLSRYLDFENEPERGEFVWTLPADLDPLSGEYKCNAPSCRVHTANQVAKLIALYADAAYIPDHISHALYFTRRWTRYDTLDLYFKLGLLAQLAPLISDRIVRFSAPVVANCQSCSHAMRDRAQSAAQTLLQSNASKLKTERVDELLTIDPSDIDKFAPVYRHKLSAAELRGLRSKRRKITPATIGERVYERILTQQAYSTFFGAAATRHVNAITVTGSRANALMFKDLQVEYASVRNEKWEMAQAMNIPWIREMSLDQILALRSDAHKALPRFRAKMSRAFAQSDEMQPATTISELHEESIEVEQEIRGLGIGSESRFQAMLTSIGIVAAVTGAIANTEAAAVAGLVTMLTHVHKNAREDRRELHSLECKPGFVLLKSKEILDHSR